MHCRGSNAMFNRFKSLLPRWFGDQTPVLDALLHGLAATARHAHRLIEYARLQTRLQTATGGWLDLIAADSLGMRSSAGQTNRMPRSDNAFGRVCLVSARPAPD